MSISYTIINNRNEEIGKSGFIWKGLYFDETTLKNEISKKASVPRDAITNLYCRYISFLDYSYVYDIYRKHNYDSGDSIYAKVNEVYTYYSYDISSLINKNSVLSQENINNRSRIEELTRENSNNQSRINQLNS